MTGWFIKRNSIQHINSHKRILLACKRKCFSIVFSILALGNYFCPCIPLILPHPIDNPFLDNICGRQELISALIINQYFLLWFLQNKTYSVCQPKSFLLPMLARLPIVLPFHHDLFFQWNIALARMYHRQQNKCYLQGLQIIRNIAVNCSTL